MKTMLNIVSLGPRYIRSVQTCVRPVFRWSSYDMLRGL